MVVWLEKSTSISRVNVKLQKLRKSALSFTDQSSKRKIKKRTVLHKMSHELFSNVFIILLLGKDNQVMQLTVTQYRGIVMHLTHPDDEMINSKLNEELIRYVTNEFKHHYNFLITGSPSTNKTFRLYMVDKSDFLQLPLYKYKNDDYRQRTHAYQCVLHDFFLQRTYELNGFKPCTLPAFLPPKESNNYKKRVIGNDIVSVEYVHEGLPIFPFDAAHCCSNEIEMTSTPLSTKDDPERNEEKMLKVIKIIHRIRKLRPSMTIFPICHCVFSKYNELPDDI